MNERTFPGLYFLEKFPSERYFQLVVDGALHRRENGTAGFNAREPNTTAAFYHAFIYALNHLDKPLSVDLILGIHKVITHKVSGELCATLLGEFRNGTESPFIVPKTRSTPNGILELINKRENDPLYGWLKKAEMAAGDKDLFRLSKEIVTRDIRKIHHQSAFEKSPIDYCPPELSPVEIRQAVENLLSRYATDMQNAKTNDEKILAIAKLIHRAELIHPFFDANGRTFVNVLLNYLLIKEGFPPATFYEPNVFDLYSELELVDVIKDAMHHTLFTIEHRDMKLYGYDATNLPEEEKTKQKNLAKEINQLIATYTAKSTMTKDQLQLSAKTIQYYCDNPWDGSINFHRASALGDLAKINELLKKPNDSLFNSARVHVAPLYKGKTPLQIAALTAQTEVIKLLLDHRPDLINDRDYEGNTALHYAVMLNDTASIQVLLAHHAEIEIKNNDGKSILEIAAHYGDPATFQLLFTIAEFDSKQFEYLFKETITKGNVPLFNWLLTQPQIETISKPSNKLSLLYAAARGKNVEIFEKLYDLIRNKKLFTYDEFISLALYTVKHKNTNLFDFTYKYTDFSTQTKPLTYVDLMDAIDMNTALKEHDALFKLLDIEKDINSIKEPDGGNLLHVAIAFHNINFTKYLLQRGIKINEYDREGYTPLHHAVLLNQLELIQLLCEQPDIKINVEKSPEDSSSSFWFLTPIPLESQKTANTTPLSLAIGAGNLNAATLLIKKGATVDENSVKHLDKCRKNKEAMRTLLTEAILALNKSSPRKG